MMLKYKDKKWYQFWQPESNKTNFSQKEEAFPCCGHWCIGERTQAESALLTAVPRQHSHALSYLGLAASLRTHTCRLQHMACAGCETTTESLAGSHSQKEHAEGCGEVLDHSCIKLSYAKRFCAVVSTISVLSNVGRGNKSEVLSQKWSYLCWDWFMHSCLDSPSLRQTGHLYH